MVDTSGGFPIPLLYPLYASPASSWKVSDST